MHMVCLSLLLAAGILGGGVGLKPSVAVGQEKDTAKGKLISIDGLQSRTPVEWIEEKTTKPFHVHDFRLPAVGADKNDAELVIFFFGEGAGGSVADNIKRWKAQMLPPAGKNIEDLAKLDKLKIGDVEAAYFDLQGTYLFKARPFDPNSPVSKRPNYRMIKVVFESKKGPYFISLLGPADAVALYKKGFDNWVKAFK
jgi:hypothetical protein